MTNWFGITGAAVLALLGTLHLIYTLRDMTSSARFFAPRDPDLLDAMRHTKVGIAPKGRDYWQALLGFHISHSLAVLMMAGIVAFGSTGEPPWLAAIGLMLTSIYAVLAWRFWFAIPMWGCLIAAALQVIGLTAG